MYDVMAHPDLAKVFGHRPEPAPAALYVQMAEAFAEAGVCAEVSTAGYRRALGEIYPAPELLSELRRRGVPVTLASDAHGPERVGERFDDALRVLTEAGYTTITLFQARERRQEPLP
jgi:histidinol-phosphatase (PHP family)